MPDTISAADRALIAAHIARYGVTHVAPGVSGIPDVDDRVLLPMIRARVVKKEARWERVVELHAQGASIAAIAEQLRTPENTVKNDITKLRACGRIGGRRD